MHMCVSACVCVSVCVLRISKVLLAALQLHKYPSGNVSNRGAFFAFKREGGTNTNRQKTTTSPPTVHTSTSHREEEAGGHGQGRALMSVPRSERNCICSLFVLLEGDENPR